MGPGTVGSRPARERHLVEASQKKSEQSHLQISQIRMLAQQRVFVMNCKGSVWDIKLGTDV